MAPPNHKPRTTNHKYHPVYIVGAGPGDPELLTIRAFRLLSAWAEVVVYDRLIPEELLRIIPKRVERIYAGKSCKTHVMTQDEINRELVKQAKRGKKVVRLKGGDPFIFGRGGEEIEYLHKHKIGFEVVPGISAASGISAKFGIPLTHRGLATSVRFITGHQQKGKPVVHDWKSLANPETTLVVYMGLAHLDEIAKKLMKAGLSKTTPAVAVQDGTTAAEKVVSGTLATIAKKVQKAGLQAPTTVFIGRVVKVAKKAGKV